MPRQHLQAAQLPRDQPGGEGRSTPTGPGEEEQEHLQLGVGGEPGEEGTGDPSADGASKGPGLLGSAEAFPAEVRAWRVGELVMSIFEIG